MISSIFKKVSLLSICTVCTLSLLGCESKNTLSSAMSIAGSGAESTSGLEGLEAFSAPSLSFGKNDQTDSALLKSNLTFLKTYVDVAEKAHVFPVELQAGDQIKVHLWSEQLAVLMMFGPENQEGIWKDEQWREATQTLKPGLDKQETTYTVEKTGRHVVVVAPYQNSTEYLLNLQCLSGSCMNQDLAQ